MITTDDRMDAIGRPAGHRAAGRSARRRPGPAGPDSAPPVRPPGPERDCGDWYEPILALLDHRPAGPGGA